MSPTNKPAWRTRCAIAESRRVIGLFAAWRGADALARENPMVSLALLERLTLRGLFPRVFQRRGARISR